MELDSHGVEQKTFDVVRRGYDQTQVAEFLDKVANSMSHTDERRKIAEVRAEQLEREFRNLKTRADATIQETVAARVRLLDAAPDGTPAASTEPSNTAVVNRAKLEAQQIIEQANVRATAMQAEAEAVIGGALSTSAKINQERNDLLGSTGAERAGLIAAAIEEASAIRDEAMQVAEHARAEAAGHAAKIRHRAEIDAERLTTEARMRAREITANAEQQREELLASVEKSRTRHGEIDQRAESPVPAHAPEPSDPAVSAADEFEQIAVDLREEPAEDELVSATEGSKVTRYKSRSANLPHLGDDAASVIGSLGNLRSKH
jgi:DivIVA domain-containing protein